MKSLIRWYFLYIYMINGTSISNFVTDVPVKDVYLKIFI